MIVYSRDKLDNILYENNELFQNDEIILNINLDKINNFFVIISNIRLFTLDLYSFNILHILDLNLIYQN
jgi:hypothetical protein